MTPTASTVFDTDTASTPAGEHRYALELSDRWATTVGGPLNGGYLLATALRALQREVPHPDLLVASAHYLRPGTSGPAAITTETARVGRRTATGQATLTRQNREILRVLATFTDLTQHRGATHTSNTPPELPAPEQCLDPFAEIGSPGTTIAQQVQYRTPRIPGFFHGTPGGTTNAEFWMRFSDGRDPDPLALALLVDAAAPVVFDLGAVGSSTIELTVNIRHRPAPGWLACRVRTDYLTNGLHDEDFEIWDSTGILVAQSRQLALIPE
ncbi:thioesterase family protein [Nocardia sp. NPDC050710]|uniref:thioesterase family protein n=1 Tax=Nocardia sp. NPDC050710 TaxID=3157220 RepID=UPI0033CEEF5F